MKITELIGLLEVDSLPDQFESVMGNEGGDKEKVGTGTKRKREGEEDIQGGGGGGELLGVPPTNDIYRSRQQKRVHAM